MSTWLPLGDAAGHVGEIERSQEVGEHVLRAAIREGKISTRARRFWDNRNGVNKTNVSLSVDFWKIVNQVLWKEDRAKYVEIAGLRRPGERLDQIRESELTILEASGIDVSWDDLTKAFPAESIPQQPADEIAATHQAATNIVRPAASSKEWEIWFLTYKAECDSRGEVPRITKIQDAAKAKFGERYRRNTVRNLRNTLAPDWPEKPGPRGPRKRAK